MNVIRIRVEGYLWETPKGDSEFGCCSSTIVRSVQKRDTRRRRRRHRPPTALPTVTPIHRDHNHHHPLPLPSAAAITNYHHRHSRPPLLSTATATPNRLPRPGFFDLLRDTFTDEEWKDILKVRQRRRHFWTISHAFHAMPPHMRRVPYSVAHAYCRRLLEYCNPMF